MALLSRIVLNKSRAEGNGPQGNICLARSQPRHRPEKFPRVTRKYKRKALPRCALNYSLSRRLPSRAEGIADAFIGGGSLAL